MATLGLVENGVRRRHKKRRRRNPSTATKSTARKNPAKRRSISVASAKAVLKRNGLKAVSKSVANPKRRKHRRRRNGVTATRSTGFSLTRRNGILGNTKGDVKTVGSVLGGGALTKLLGRVVLGYATPYLSQMGLGKYAEIVVDAAVALVATPFLVGKVIKGGDVAKQARLGGLLVVGIDVLEAFAPSVLSYNPFSGNSSPIVMTGSGPAVSPAAVAQIAAGVANSPNPSDTAAKVGRAMLSMDAAGAQYASSRNSYAGSAPELVL